MGCGSCSACGGKSEAAQEYISKSGYYAVRCPLCGQEMTFLQRPENLQIICQECLTKIKIIPVVLN